MSVGYIASVAAQAICLSNHFKNGTNAKVHRIYYAGLLLVYPTSLVYYIDYIEAYVLYIMHIVLIYIDSHSMNFFDNGPVASSTASQRD